METLLFPFTFQVKVFMENILPMKILSSNIMEAAGYAWLILVKILMVLNFISLWQERLGLMAIILALEKFLKEWYAEGPLQTRHFCLDTSFCLCV